MSKHVDILEVSRLKGNSTSFAPNFSNHQRWNVQLWQKYFCFALVCTSRLTGRKPQVPISTCPVERLPRQHMCYINSIRPLVNASLQRLVIGMCVFRSHAEAKNIIYFPRRLDTHTGSMIMDAFRWRVLCECCADRHTATQGPFFDLFVGRGSV